MRETVSFQSLIIIIYKGNLFQFASENKFSKCFTAVAEDCFGRLCKYAALWHANLCFMVLRTTEMEFPSSITVASNRNKFPLSITIINDRYRILLVNNDYRLTKSHLLLLLLTKTFNFPIVHLGWPKNNCTCFLIVVTNFILSRKFIVRHLIVQTCSRKGQWLTIISLTIVWRRETFCCTI